MKAVTKKTDRRTAFTIVELLTVMSIIIILIGLLVPSLNMVKRYAKRVKQKAQFHSIKVAMDLFATEREGYPDSVAFDAQNNSYNYCGSMKLCEAMMGQDLLGFNPKSQFNGDLLDGAGEDLYPQTPPLPGSPGYAIYVENMKSRKGPYLQIENANAYRLRHLYGAGIVPNNVFNEERFVMCDVYNRVNLKPALGENISGKTGMPILYYKANTANTLHDYQYPDKSIYNYLDNDELVQLGLPWNTGLAHPM